MPTVILVLTILPDGEEKWRRFAQDLLGEPPRRVQGLGRHLGIRGLRAYLPDGYVAGRGSPDDPSRLLGLLARARGS